MLQVIYWLGVVLPKSDVGIVPVIGRVLLQAVEKVHGFLHIPNSNVASLTGGIYEILEILVSSILRPRHCKDTVVMTSQSLKRIDFKRALSLTSNSRSGILWRETLSLPQLYRLVFTRSSHEIEVRLTIEVD